MGYFLAILSGLGTALGGVGYKYADRGNVKILQSSAFLSVCGILWFGIRAIVNGELANTSVMFWISTVGVGIIQYLGVALLEQSFKMGPLSLVWCAASLQFMPGVLFAHFRYDEPMTWLHWVAVVMILGAIAAASFGGNTAEKSPRGDWKFALTLVAMLCACSSMGILLKFACYYHEAEMTESMLERVPNLLMAVIYMMILLFAAGDLTIRKAWRFNRYALTGGVMLSVGVLLSFALQIVIMELPGMIVFAMSYSTSILGAGLISTLFMGEKRTRAWYATLLLSLSAIILMTL